MLGASAMPELAAALRRIPLKSDDDRRDRGGSDGAVMHDVASGAQTLAVVLQKVFQPPARAEGGGHDMGLSLPLKSDDAAARLPNIMFHVVDGERPAPPLRNGVPQACALKAWGALRQTWAGTTSATSAAPCPASRTPSTPRTSTPSRSRACGSSTTRSSSSARPAARSSPSDRDPDPHEGSLVGPTELSTVVNPYGTQFLGVYNIPGGPESRAQAVPHRPVRLGLGRIVPLHGRASTSHRTH